MKQITLNIEEGKYQDFISFIKTLDYVSVSQDQQIPDWQKEEISNRLSKLESGEITSRSWEEAKKDIFKA